MSARTKKISLPLGYKLVSAMIFLLLCSLGSLVWLSTRLFVRDTTAMIQQVNSDAASSIAARLGDVLGALSDKMQMATAMVLDPKGAQGTDLNSLKTVFAAEKYLLAMMIVVDRGGKPEVLSSYTSAELGMDPQDQSLFSQLHDLNTAAVFKGEVQTTHCTLRDGTVTICVGIPVVKRGEATSDFTHIAISLVRAGLFQKSLGTQTIARTFATDYRGRLLATADPALGEAGQDLSHLKSVEMMLQGKSSNAQGRYLDPENDEAWLSAYHTVGFGGVGVVAEVPEKKAVESTVRMERRALFIAIMVLSVFIFVGYLFSSSLTRRLSVLVEATHKISSGDFSLRLAHRGRDEIAWLSSAFNEMSEGLQERDKVKDVFNRFHSKEIADKLLSGEVKLGGERRDAYIFFSDIRAFTTMSEALQPEEVVEMLNEYMTAMVRIIRSHGGVVDKYVGDAIMALWGVPNSTGDEGLQAVRACLAMRQELAQLNELRLLRHQTPLKIGMGLNYGSVIAGNIGSEEKMEYTVVGDSVNLASRVESMTKEMKTDFLITEAVKRQIEGRFTFEPAGSVIVKGKTEATTLYKVPAEIIVHLNEEAA